MLVRMEKRGVFDVGMVADDACQCGTRGLREFHYHVVIECSEDALDSQGFIVDSLRLKDYMETRFRDIAVLPSCERMCAIAAREIAEGLCEERISKVSVQLGNGMEGWMTAEWRRADVLQGA